MPNFEIVQVRTEYPNGKIDGIWVQGCCGRTLEEATERCQSYADSGRGTPYTLIAGDSGYISPGHLFPSQTPLCPILRNPQIVD